MKSLAIIRVLAVALNADGKSRDQGNGPLITDDDRNEALKTITSLVDSRLATMKHWNMDELMMQQAGCDNDTFIVNSPQALDICNIMTYDVYGKLYAAFGDAMTFEQYVTACNDTLSIPLPREVLAEGYDFVADLWHGSEIDGQNRANGTYDDDEK